MNVTTRSMFDATSTQVDGTRHAMQLPGELSDRMRLICSLQLLQLLILTGCDGT